MSNETRKRMQWSHREFRRPEIQVMVDKEPLNAGCDVCIQVGAEYGQPMRWIEMTASEARELASHLVEIASLADQSEKAA
jgi:hypothetical protein